MNNFFGKLIKCIKLMYVSTISKLNKMYKRTDLSIKKKKKN